MHRAVHCAVRIYMQMYNIYTLLYLCVRFSHGAVDHLNSGYYILVCVSLTILPGSTIYCE